MSMFLLIGKAFGLVAFVVLATLAVGALSALFAYDRLRGYVRRPRGECRSSQ